MNSRLIFFVSSQAETGFLNTLCENEFYRKLRIYKDIFETPGNICNMLYLQNVVRAVFKREQE